MRVSKLVLVLALMGGALLAGCVDDVRFNPSGCDVQVRGRWLVDGQNPTAETCGNIALVELTIIDEPELEFWAAPEFLLKCDAKTDSNAVIIDGGAYLDTMLVTRNRCGGTGEILAKGRVDGPPVKLRVGVYTVDVLTANGVIPITNVRVKPDLRHVVNLTNNQESLGVSDSYQSLGDIQDD